MKIWLFQIGESLPIQKRSRKMRTAWLAEELAQRGHSVFWWASAFDHQKKQWLEEDRECVLWNNNINIILLKGCGYSKNVSLKRFIDHKILAKNFKKRASHYPKPDLIVTSMPSHDLAGEAVQFGKQHQIPVVVDIRDQWPDTFLDYLPQGLKPLARILLKNDFEKVKTTFREATALSSMMDTVLQWGLTYAQRQQNEWDRVFYLGGIKNEKNVNLSASTTVSSLLPNLEQKLVITFFGTFGLSPWNNPSILVDVAKRFLNQPVAFIIAGDGLLLDEIKQRAQNLTNVFFTGWLYENDISALLSISDLGVCPATKSVAAFPNKVFSYFSAGLPVILSCEGDLKFLIEKYEIGLYCQPGEVDAIERFICKILQNTDYLQELKKNAQIFFEEYLNAAHIYRDFASHLEALHKLFST